MEVTKQGITPKTWRGKVRCPRCEAGLKISWKDIFIRTTRKETLFSHKHILHYRITCSECGCIIELDDDDIPEVIQKKVFDNMDMYDRMMNFYFT